MEGAGVLSPRAMRDLLVAGPAHGPRAVAAFIVRVAGGGVFVAFTRSVRSRSSGACCWSSGS
jgi:hypothetical protein